MGIVKGDVAKMEQENPKALVELVREIIGRTVVLRYRSHLECRQLAPGTINLHLDAVRRLACEAADCGLLSADLAAAIRCVKGVKKLEVRLGNWLTAERAQSLWRAPDCKRLKGNRDRGLLVAGELRRHEAVAPTLDHLQQSRAVRIGRRIASSERDDSRVARRHGEPLLLSFRLMGILKLQEGRRPFSRSRLELGRSRSVN